MPLQIQAEALSVSASVVHERITCPLPFKRTQPDNGFSFTPPVFVAGIARAVEGLAVACVQQGLQVSNLRVRNCGAGVRAADPIILENSFRDLFGTRSGFGNPRYQAVRLCGTGCAASMC